MPFNPRPNLWSRFCHAALITLGWLHSNYYQGEPVKQQTLDCKVTKTGIKTRTALVAGEDPFRGYLHDFVNISVASFGEPKMVDILNATNQKCKSAGGGSTCDNIAEYFGLTFGHG
jgi:hypothetical protein